MSHPRVLNVRRDRDAILAADREGRYVYAGRGRCPVTGMVGTIGNPYTVRDHGPDAMRLFLDLEAQLAADGLAAPRRLAGFVLGCWCAPGPCHAEVLARLADGEPLEKIRADVLAAVELDARARREGRRA